MAQGLTKYFPHCRGQKLEIDESSAHRALMAGSGHDGLHRCLLACQMHLAVAVALLLAIPSAGVRACDVSLWENRLDTDLERFELGGISLDDVHHAAKLPCGGYLVSILGGKLYATPLGWETRPSVLEQRAKTPHVYLVMFNKLLCRYPDLPDVTFVINTYDK